MLRERLRKILSEDLIESLEGIVKELINRYDPISIILTGSVARERFVHGISDIDIIVIVRESPGKDRFLLRAINNINIEITIIGIEELIKAVKQGNQFYIEALKGIEIYGNINTYIKLQ